MNALAAEDTCNLPTCLPEQPFGRPDVRRSTWRVRESAKIDQVPSPPAGTVDVPEAEGDYLSVGGVFTSDLIETWADDTGANEVDAVRLRPHPWEFVLYRDI